MFFASIIKIKDPTHLIRRNIIQFSKVYRQQLIKSLTSFLIISSNHFDVKNLLKIFVIVLVIRCICNSYNLSELQMIVNNFFKLMNYHNRLSSWQRY